MQNESKIVSDFLNSIGIECIEDETANGFIENVEIRNGVLYFSPQCTASALLHEAGHLACCPGEYRYLMNGNLYKSIRKISDQIDELDLSHDDPLLRAIMQMSDPEATSWAWAAGKYIGIPEERIILDEEYANSGSEIRMGLRHNAYLGINGLSSAGFCAVTQGYAIFTQQKCYPDLNKWVQPVFRENPQIKTKLSKRKPA